MSSATHTHTRHNNGKMGSVSDELSDLKDTVRSGVHDSTESGKRVVQAAGAAAINTVSGLHKSAMRTRDQVGRSISERPFTAVAIAAGVGALLGAGLMWRRR